MRVFVLGTGRCGTVTFSKACEYIENYSVGHESLWGYAGNARLAYPDNNIEVDNRLVWFLGALHKRFGADTFYLHLTRNKADVIESFVRRGIGLLAHWWGCGVLYSDVVDSRNFIGVMDDYVETVTANIEEFISDKPSMTGSIETSIEWFPEFCHKIGARFNKAGALNELRKCHNATIKSDVISGRRL